MLPHSNYCPPEFAESFVDKTISHSIPLQLGAPVIHVRPWDVTVFGASMPEAPVNEDRQPLTGKRDIGTNPSTPSRDVDQQILAESKSTPVEERPQSDLRARIPGSIAERDGGGQGGRGVGIRKLRRHYEAIVIAAKCQTLLPNYSSVS